MVKFLLLIIILSAIGCADKSQSRALNVSCEGQSVIGDWAETLASTGEGIMFASNCKGADVACDQEFEFGMDGSTVHIYAHNLKGSQCFGYHDTCEAVIIDHVLELDCGRFTKSYKR